MTYSVRAPTTFGALRRRLDLPGLTLIESIYKPSLEIASHAHDLPVSVFVLEGTVTTRSDASVVTTGPNSVRVVPAGEKHSNTYGARGARCFLVEVKPEIRAHIGEHSVLLERPFPSSASGTTRIFRRMYEEFAIDDDVAQLGVHSCLLELVTLLARTKTRRLPPAWLTRVRDMLTDRYRESITIRQLSEDAHIHPVQLARQFRHHYGCSPSDYVRTLRVEWARRALRQTDEPLSCIAADAGFADQSHFTREFRRQIGMTPANYRASARN